MKRYNYLKFLVIILVLIFTAGCATSISTTPSTYTVTFNSQGGSAVSSQVVGDGELATEPTAPTKTGYTFGGWYKESGCTNAWVFATNTVTSDVTLYAKWTANPTYTVTYNGNGSTGGTVPVDPSSPYEYGATVTVLGNTGNLTRINDGGTSYRFTAWNTKADGSGAYQAEGSTFTIGASNVTLYAQWTPYILRDTGPAGGLIFYDKGIYSNGWRYLEAAPVFTEWTGIQWGSYGTLIGGTETDIGAGQSNTTTIVTWLDNNSETGRASQLCNDLIVNGYSDWFLPSTGELNPMYTNLKVAGVGGFANDSYWSSSETSALTAWARDFDDGDQFNDGKYGTLQVRAVRAF